MSSLPDRRRFLSRSANALCLTALAPFLSLREAKAASWRKLQVGPPPAGLYGWGANTNGQLGDCTTTNRCVPTRVCISNVLMAATSKTHSLAVLQNGCVMSWGSNACGQLGINNLVDKSTPVLVCGISTAVAVAAGCNSSYALLSDGKVTSWGDNTLGALGDNSVTARSIPVTVCGITTAIAISDAMALLADGTVRSWGVGTNGQNGDNSTSNRSTPVAVSGISTAVALSNGGAQRFAVLANGTLRAWGRNIDGTIGNNVCGGSVSSPVSVCAISNAVSVYTGCTHSYALLASGAIMSWGSAANGRLGNGVNTGTFLTPVSVCGISSAVAIGGSLDGGIALLADGSMKSWGSGTSGILGNGSTTSVCVPATLPSIANAFANVARARSIKYRLPSLSRGETAMLFLHLG